MIKKLTQHGCLVFFSDSLIPINTWAVHAYPLKVFIAEHLCQFCQCLELGPFSPENVSVAVQ